MKDLLTRAILCNFLYIKKLQNKNGSAWLPDRVNVRQPFDYHGKECEMTTGEKSAQRKEQIEQD